MEQSIKGFLEVNLLMRLNFMELHSMFHLLIFEAKTHIEEAHIEYFYL